MTGQAVRVLVNGQLMDSVSTTDRGLLYGDGVFETIACVSGQLHYWQQHMQRLQTGCERLGLGVIDTDRLLDESLGLVDGSQRGVLKIIVTRGPGGRGYRVPTEVTPTRIIQLHDWPVYPESNEVLGIKAIICHTRLGHNPLLAGIKHLNRLEQVMARREWQEAEIMEGLMLDSSGHVIEGTMTNLFLVKDEGLLTPDLTQCGVAGIMRARILDKAKQQAVATEVRAITVDELQQADEVFVCNSVIGIWPVLRINDFNYEKGQLTTRLLTLLANDGDK